MLANRNGISIAKSETGHLSAMDFVLAVDIAGQLHEQIRDLPPGTKVSGFALTDVPRRANQRAKPKTMRGRRRP